MKKSKFGHLEQSSISDLRVDESPTLITGKKIVDEDGGPAAVAAQSDLVCSGGTEAARDHHLPDEVLALGQHGQCGEQPAVAQNALRDIRGKGGAEHRPGDLVVAGYLVRPQPPRYTVVRGVFGVVEERPRRRREGVVDEVLSVLLAKFQDPLPRVPRLGLLHLEQKPQMMQIEFPAKTGFRDVPAYCDTV